MKFLGVFVMTASLAIGATSTQASMNDQNSDRPSVNAVGLPGGGAWQERPFRLSDIDPKSFTAEQRRVNEDVNHYLNLKQLSGPFRFWATDPRVLGGLLGLLKAENQSRALGERLTRLIAITVAQQWKAQFEWFVQAALAKRDGISPDVIEAIRLGKRPKFSKADEELVYNAVNELDRRKSLSDATFKRLYAAFGHDGVVEFITFDGFFTMVGMAVTATDMKAPAPFPPNPVP